MAARGHEFIVINTDYDGKQFGKDGKVNTDGITELLYPHPLTEAEMIGWLDEIAVLDPFTGRFNTTLIKRFFFFGGWLGGVSTSRTNTRGMEHPHQCHLSLSLALALSLSFDVRVLRSSSC